MPLLDLGLTLLCFNECTSPAVCVTDEDQALAARLVQEAALPFMQRTVFTCPGIGYYTKLRPGVRQFLTAVAPFFELWILTNGCR